MFVNPQFVSHELLLGVEAGVEVMVLSNPMIIVLLTQQ